MTIATAPTRIGLFGGGTDLPVFYERFGGMVINIGINLYQRIALDDCTIKGLFIQRMPENGDEKFYTGFLEEYGVNNVELSSSFDGIVESGLGSSASCAVALIGAIAKHAGIYLKRREIAEKAWDMEVNKLGLYGGKQDQYAAVYGQMNVLWFNRNGGVYIKQIDRSKAEFIARNILLFYTGSNRKSIKVQEGLRELTPEKTASLMEIKRLADLAYHYVETTDITRLGELLNEAWKQKKASNNVSNTRIDDLYEAGLSAGAEAGKLMGSGGGGFMFFIVKPENQKRVITQMEELGCKRYDFSVDFNGLLVRQI